jgi:hypothetical protein
MSQPEKLQAPRARAVAVWRTRGGRARIVVIAAACVVLIVLGIISEPRGGVKNAAPSQHPHSAVQNSAGAVTAPTPTATASSNEPVEQAQVRVSAAAMSTTSAAALLAAIPIRPALTMAGYDRTADFGTAWLDEDHNGCDTRNDILTRDLTALSKSGACKILTGVLVSPYTGATINFLRGQKTSALVQVDHLVALGDAWETGAQSLSKSQRETLANDPLELLAVDGRSNDQKGDKDASQWLPSNRSFACSYVARQISVKVTYSLWVTPAEHAAMATVLSKCGAITGTASPFAAVLGAPPASTSRVVPPSPLVSAPVVVAPASPASTTRVVHPGAFCAAADAGQHGVTPAGTAMVCETSPTDTRLRWRAG